MNPHDLPSLPTSPIRARHLQAEGQRDLQAQELLPLGMPSPWPVARRPASPRAATDLQLKRLRHLFLAFPKHNQQALRLTAPHKLNVHLENR